MCLLLHSRAWAGDAAARKARKYCNSIVGDRDDRRVGSDRYQGRVCLRFCRPEGGRNLMLLKITQTCSGPHGNPRGLHIPLTVHNGKLGINRCKRTCRMPCTDIL